MTLSIGTLAVGTMMQWARLIFFKSYFMLIYKFLIFFKVTEAAREIARKLATIMASGDKLKWLLEEKNYQINILQRLSKLLVWRSFTFYKNKQTTKSTPLPWPRRRIGCLIGTQSNTFLPLLQKVNGERPVGMGLPLKPVALHHTIWPVIVCQHTQRPKLFIDDALGDRH